VKQDWSPQLYLKFANERTRPAMDLLAHVGLSGAVRVFDLGYGPGNSTALLLQAFPHARVTGIDNSPAMLERARMDAPGAVYELADVRDWSAPADADLIFSNATLQWVPGHAEMMLRFLKGLKPGAVLAAQMPDNLNEPSHVLMRKVAADQRWADRLQGAATVREKLLDASGYHNLLQAHCSSLEVWRTSYNHHLANHAAIVEFASSTGLRPFLEPLDEEQRLAFKAAYAHELQSAYPLLQDGSVLLAFPRLFIIARR
jgi:trans-aconitate 2-methyltransferase